MTDFWGIFAAIAVVLYVSAFITASVALYGMNYPYWFLPIVVLIIQVIYIIKKEAHP